MSETFGLTLLISIFCATICHCQLAVSRMPLFCLVFLLFVLVFCSCDLFAICSVFLVLRSPVALQLHFEKFGLLPHDNVNTTLMDIADFGSIVKIIHAHTITMNSSTESKATWVTFSKTNALLRGELALKSKVILAGLYYDWTINETMSYVKNIVSITTDIF